MEGKVYMKSGYRLTAMLIALLLTVSIVSGCKPKAPEETADWEKTKDCLWGDELGAVEDSSEIPDWTGKKLTLNYWNIDETGGLASYVAGANDSVRKEIERVTGVTIDESKSFDNNGMNFPTKYTDVVSSDNFPSITYGTQNVERLVKADKMYELSSYIDKYAPNVLKIMKKEYKSGVWDKVTVNGKTYGIPLEMNETNAPLIYPEADPSRFETKNKSYTYIWVRDDILKMIYPNAKTQQEIEDQYVQTGQFTKEEILDVSFKSLDDLTDFLRKVKALNLEVPAFPVAAYDGVDNWGLYQFVFSSFEGYAQEQSDMMFKFDTNKKELSNNIRSEYFKTSLKKVWGWFREGLSPKESLIDDRNTYEEKINNGKYAITTGFYWEPNNVAIKRNKFKFQYRRVYIDTPSAPGSVNFISPPNALTAISFVKDKVAETDLPQLVRFVDFMFTKAGQRLVGWGSQSAGLYTQDENGNRKFKDSALESQMLTTDETNLIIDNGLGFNKVYDSAEIMMSTGWLPMAFRSNRGIYGPYYGYNERKPTDYFLAFDPDVNSPKSEPVVGFSPKIWSYASDTECPKFKKLWDKRFTLWESLQKVLTSKDDADFETKYNAAMKSADDIGLTKPEILKEANDFYKKLNEGTALFD